MRQLLKLGFLAVIIAGGSGIPCFAAEDDGSKIAIIAPKNGETVGETFALKYDPMYTDESVTSQTAS